eukprot:1208427-Rhodomonas_salina.1
MGLVALPLQGTSPRAYTRFYGADQFSVVPRGCALLSLGTVNWLHVIVGVSPWFCHGCVSSGPAKLQKGRDAARQSLVKPQYILAGHWFTTLVPRVPRAGPGAPGLAGPERRAVIRHVTNLGHGRDEDTPVCRRCQAVPSVVPLGPGTPGTVRVPVAGPGIAGTRWRARISCLRGYCVGVSSATS